MRATGLLILAGVLGASAAPATTLVEPPPDSPEDGRRFVLVEEFTASTLGAGEVKLGTDFDLGLTEGVMVGTDVVALAIGATTLQAKMRVFQRGEHLVALGVRAAYLSKDTLLWGSAMEHFDELDARIVRPQIAWTNEVSPRLRLHTFWAKGFGRIKARLSEKGRRKLWETKHPGADYENRDRDTQKPADDAGADDGDATDDATNREREASERSALTSQSIQVQSITGLAQDRFQLTGEFSRASGNKVLVTSRIEQTTFEELKSNFFRLTAAHQWIWTNFQIRLGVGLQYYVMSGRDLDGETIDESGAQPASDIAFYWRF